MSTPSQQPFWPRAPQRGAPASKWCLWGLSIAGMSLFLGIFVALPLVGLTIFPFFLTGNKLYLDQHTAAICSIVWAISTLSTAIVGTCVGLGYRLPRLSPSAKRWFKVASYVGLSLVVLIVALLITICFGDLFVAHTYAGKGAGDDAMPTSVAIKNGFVLLWLRYIVCAFLMILAAVFSFCCTGPKLGLNVWHSRREFWLGRLLFLIGAVLVLVTAAAAYSSGVAILEKAGIPRTGAASRP
jgi:hypothetical protein